MVSFERSEEPGALKSHLHFMCEFPPVLYSKLLPHLKKRNYRDLCVDGIFKSLVAGIIKVPIRLYWSLTLIEDTSIKKRLLCSLLCRYL